MTGAPFMTQAAGCGICSFQKLVQRGHANATPRIQPYRLEDGTPLAGNLFRVRSASFTPLQLGMIFADSERGSPAKSGRP